MATSRRCGSADRHTTSNELDFMEYLYERYTATEDPFTKRKRLTGILNQEHIIRCHLRYYPPNINPTAVHNKVVEIICRINSAEPRSPF